MLPVELIFIIFLYFLIIFFLLEFIVKPNSKFEALETWKKQRRMRNLKAKHCIIFSSPRYLIWL